MNQRRTRFRPWLLIGQVLLLSCGGGAPAPPVGAEIELASDAFAEGLKGLPLVCRFRH